MKAMLAMLTIVNIVGGYGYHPALMSMPACVDAACNGGRIAP